MKTLLPCVLALVCLASDAAPPVLAQAPVLKIVQPTPDVYLLGAVELVADVSPASVIVTDVTFVVDGQQVCRVTSRPFKCSFDAGSRTGSRTVRVKATLASGMPLVETVRTKGLNLAQSATAEAILVSVHVSDDRGRFVEGLTQSQFRVLEDGVPQDVTSFLAENASSSLLLALDISGSMSPAVGELRSATSQFLQSLRPTDRITLTGFSNSLFVLAPANADAATRQAALEQLHPAGGTALYDSMIRGVELLKPQASPRAMVVFTDGDDDASLATLDDVRSSLQSNDVVLYFIAQGRADRDATLRGELAKLAAETGGAAYFSSRMSSLQEHFANIVADLSHQYVVGYSPKRDLGDGGLRKISVQVEDRDRKLTVRHRQSYLAVHRGGVP
ncbi:MAG TPA: VWA domain-containing protein [Vicinamibacterales bacterium]|nr:VWA domain-containing protein [Vicinamibacterales bacterium]